MIFMPEGPEVRIMSDYINTHSINREFNSIQHIDKNNTEVSSLDVFGKFSLFADTNGKEMILNLLAGSQLKKVSVFMGMSGNWKFVSTKDWEQSKYIRLKIDSSDGHSFILYGGYMGPKYSLTGFTSKRGPDPTKEFDKFKKNILDNLSKKTFDKPICEALLDQKYFNGIGAYLTAEIVGRLDFNPFTKINKLSLSELDNLFNMILRCCIESYSFGGGELKDWKNPFNPSRIKEWLRFYGNKKDCQKYRFGKRNIWIKNKFIT